MNFGAFLGDVQSSVEILSPGQCKPGDAQPARFGNTRFAEANTVKWQPFATAKVPGGTKLQSSSDADKDTFVLRPGVQDVDKNVTLSGSTQPALISDYPNPQADFSAIRSKTGDGLTNLERVRLARWGTPYDRAKDTSCVTPDYPAVQS